DVQLLRCLLFPELSSRAAKSEAVPAATDEILVHELLELLAEVFGNRIERGLFECLPFPRGMSSHRVAELLTRKRRRRLTSRRLEILAERVKENERADRRHASLPMRPCVPIGSVQGRFGELAGGEFAGHGRIL